MLLAPFLPYLQCNITPKKKIVALPSKQPHLQLKSRHPSIMTIRSIGSERELKNALDTYAADVMVFNFHAPWCGACAQAEPLYHELVTDSERPRRGQSTRARRNSPAS